MAIVCYNCFREKEGNGPCHYCGYDLEQDKEKYVHALPCGTVLAGKYIIGRVLGQGGFGITYIAQDHSTGKLVAVKEFFPETMSGRGSSNVVVPYSGQYGEDFFYGKDTFLDEAKTLAQFNNSPNIIHVYSYFEENGTAYFAMEYAAGITLQQYIENEGGKITYEQAERLLLPVMEALSVVHTKGLIHRDIKPENIIVGSDGNVKLIDFGAARYSLGEKSQSLDVVLTHGFSPFEQYSRNKGQGPYTDVYAFAATFYYAITGAVPPDSIDRVGADSLIPPGKMISGLSEARENAILRGLAVRPEDRFQTMTAFCMALLRNQPIPPPPPLTFWEKLKKWIATHRGLVVGTAAVLVLALALLFIRPTPDSAPITTDMNNDVPNIDESFSDMYNNVTGTEIDNKNESESEQSESVDDSSHLEAFDDSQDFDDISHIQNNGGFFVQVGERVYFRHYSANIWPYTGILYFGAEDLLLDIAGETEICYYDSTTDTVGVAVVDNGCGRIFYSNNGFYVNRRNSDNICHTWYLSMDGKQEKDIGEYEILGISSDGNYLALKDGDPMKSSYIFYFYDNNVVKPITFDAEDTFLSFCGIQDDQIVFLNHRGANDGGETVWQFDGRSGDLINLGTLKSDDNSDYFAEIQQYLIDDGTVHLLVAWYEGTGHFLSYYSGVKANLWEANSLDTYATPWGEEIYNTPQIWLSEQNGVQFSEFVPGDLVLSEYDVGDLVYYDDSGQPVCLYKNFIEESFYSNEAGGRLPLTMEVSGGAAFLMIGEFSRNEKEDIGWRSAYDLNKIHYLRIPLQENAWVKELYAD